MGAAITVDVKDQFKLATRLKRSPQVVANKLNKCMLNIAIDMERESKMEVPVRTGRLQNSILTERQELRYTIAPHTVYAGFVHKNNPYMDRAFNTVEPVARRELKDCVQDIVRGI